MDLLTKIFRYITKVDDPRLQNWILFNSPYLITSILVLYISFVFVYGPRFMRNRKPYKLKTFIRCYDMFQILANYYVVYKLLKGGLKFGNLSINCEPPSYKTDSADMEMVEGCWWMMVTKVVDLVETVIFVLRKRNRQISFLHLYHHISTVMLVWFFSRQYIDERTVFIPLMNCGVHVVMYTYYFISTFGSNIRNVLSRYKFMITIIQMVQFIILMSYIWNMTSANCDIGKIPSIVMFFNLLINLILFFNFYKKNYSIKNAKRS